MIRAFLIFTCLLLVPLGVAQGPPSDPGPPDEPGPSNGTGPPDEPGPSNGTGPPDSNASDEGDAHQDGRSSASTGQPPGRGPDSAPGLQRVTVEDHPSGFRTLPAVAAAHQPTIDVDAREGRLAVDGQAAFDVVVEEVLEYIDEDGDGAYSPGERVLQAFALRDLEAEVGGDGDRRDLRYAMANASVTLRFHFGGASDEAAKFDIILDSFPFTSADSRVAVAVHTGMAGGARLAEHDGQAALLGAAGERVAFLSWADNVTVDGADRAVGASVHLGADTDTRSLVYWSYPQGALIVHDPAVGITAGLVQTLGAAAPYLTGLAIGAAMMALGFEARRRYRP